MSTVYFIDIQADKFKKYKAFSYPGGELQVRLVEDQIPLAEAAEKIVITATITNGNPMELMLLIDAVRDVNLLASIHLILPYLPYARADRRFVPGDSAALETFGLILGSAFVHSILTFDVHSKVAEEAVPGLVNIDAMSIIELALMTYSERPTIILPDKGSVDRYWLNSSIFKGYSFVVCEKIRDPETGVLSGFKVPHIDNTQAIIIDDLCDGGGTFAGIGEVLKNQQPEVALDLYVSHGLFSKGFDILKKFFRHIYTTDSFPAMYQDSEFVTTFPVGGYLKSKLLTTEELHQQVEV